MKKYIISLLFLSFFAINMFSQTEKLPFGVNLAGAEFGHGSKMPGEVGKDYFYPTTKDLDYWQSKGLILLRVPFKWERIQHEVNEELTAAEINVMKNMLEESRSRGLKVILDLHNYGRRKINDKTYIIGEDDLIIEALANVWGRIAKELSSYTDVIYAYGLMNEPHDMLESTPWTRIAQGTIYEIRKYDSETAIMVGGNHWSSADRWKEVSDNLKYLYDPSDKLIFEAHVYFDEDASGVYKRSYDEEKANPFIGVERLRPFVKWLQENNFRGFVGEYGIPANDGRWMVCLDNMLSYMSQQGINGTYWAAGARWNNYILGVQPKNDYKEDMPQIKILTKYLTTK